MGIFWKKRSIMRLRDKCYDKKQVELLIWISIFYGSPFWWPTNNNNNNKKKQWIIIAVVRFVKDSKAGKCFLQTSNDCHCIDAPMWTPKQVVTKGLQYYNWKRYIYRFSWYTAALDTYFYTYCPKPFTNWTGSMKSTISMMVPRC